LEPADWTAEKPPVANTAYDSALHENEFPTQCNHCRTKATLGLEIKYMTSVCVCVFVHGCEKRENVRETAFYLKTPGNCHDYTAMSLDE